MPKNLAQLPPAPDSLYPRSKSFLPTFGFSVSSHLNTSDHPHSGRSLSSFFPRVRSDPLSKISHSASFFPLSLTSLLEAKQESRKSVERSIDRGEMCGIFPYLNYNVTRERRDILEVLFNGMRRLEYRGYDSSGIAIDSDGVSPPAPTEGGENGGEEARRPPYDSSPPLIFRREGKIRAHACVLVSAFDSISLTFSSLFLHHDLTPSHVNAQGMASPVLESMLNNSKKRSKSISIRGVPKDAVRMFIRYLYASWSILGLWNCEDSLSLSIYIFLFLVSDHVLVNYRQEEMDQFVIPLLVLSHCFVIPSVKKKCVQKMEKGFLTTENAIDVLQLARLCDAPRLFLHCFRFVAKGFNAVRATEGWKVMTKSNPGLAKEIVQSMRNAELRKKERLRKLEERKIYQQLLHGAMEALVHICRDGCRTIGPVGRGLKGGGDAPCKFPACTGLERLIHHFAGCNNRVLGGCSHCMCSRKAMKRQRS